MQRSHASDWPWMQAVCMSKYMQLLFFPIAFNEAAFPHLITGTPDGVLASNRSMGAFAGVNAPQDSNLISL